MVVYICTKFREIILKKYLERYQNYGADMNDRVLTDGWMNGWTDTQNFGWYKIPSRFCGKA